MNNNESKKLGSKKIKCSPFMNLLISFSVVLLTVIIDQITKILAVNYLKPVYDYPLWPHVLHLTYVENTGAAFGMLKNNRWVFMIASSIAVILMIVFLVYYRKKMNTFVSVSFALVIGGGIGNMIDRVAYGYVVDFINFELIDFAVFNSADSFVCIGVFLIFIYILFVDDGGIFRTLTHTAAHDSCISENSGDSDDANVRKNGDGELRSGVNEPKKTQQHRGSRALKNMRESVSSAENDDTVEYDD